MKIIEKENCRYLKGDFTWKEAIKISAQVLIEQKKIQPGWVEAVFEQTAKLGPYYVITDDLAFPHISPSDLILEVATAFVIFEKPVQFIRKDGSEVFVRYFLPLAATNGEDHMELLQQMVVLWNDQHFLKALNECKSLTDLHQLVDKING